MFFNILLFGINKISNKQEKDISTIISGQENISSSFANKLEYALGIEKEFWMNLQANYEREKKDVRENI